MTVSLLFGMFFFTCPGRSPLVLFNEFAVVIYIVSDLSAVWHDFSRLASGIMNRAAH